MQIIAFVDLDDSLFQTAAKLDPGNATAVRAIGKAGEAISFSSPIQDALFALLKEAGTIIPVTGRTDDALQRVLLPFSSFRITHHGAMLRDRDLRPTATWQEQIRPRMLVAQEAMLDVSAAVSAQLTTWRARLTVHQSEGLATYLSIKLDDPFGVFPLAEWSETLLPFTGDAGPCRWLVHGRQAAVLPHGVGKRQAVEIVKADLQAQGDSLFLGLGDSLSDGPFLRACDFCIVPSGSEIAALFGRDRC